MGSFREIVMKNVDILAIAETKIHESFPTAQFGSGGILVYVKSSIPSRQLNFPNLPYTSYPIRVKLKKGEMISKYLYIGLL